MKPDPLSRKLSENHRKFLEALCNGNLSASTGNPPEMTLAKRGLIRFVHCSEYLSVMAITDEGREMLAKASSTVDGDE